MHGVSYGAIQDLRLALRQLRRARSFTLTVIVTLALGIGLNAAIFSMVDCVLLRPLGYHDADRIYGLNTRFLQEGRSISRVGGGDFKDAATGLRSIESAAYYTSYKDGLELNGHTLYLDLGAVSPGFGQVMGVEPLAGRLFQQQGQGQEAMLSSRVARDNFGAAAAALGHTLRVGGKLFTIVAVLPDGFGFPKNSQVWVEAPPEPETPARTAYNQQVVVKVRPGVSAEALNAELAAFSKQLGTAYPEDKEKALEAVPLRDQLVGKVRPTLRLLMGSVGVLLLIVCANITHLQLVRATELRREVTIRTALGATRMALARRAAVEVLLLAVAGCAAGVLLAWPALFVLIQLAPQELPRLDEVGLNWEVVLFSLAVSVTTMAATALIPVWRSWKTDPAGALKQDAGRGTEGRGTGTLRQALIVGEVALTLTLSVAAVALLRQLVAESQQYLGFTAEQLVKVDMHSGSGSDRRANFRVLDSIRTLPGVMSAAAVGGAPMSSDYSDVLYAVHGVQSMTPGASGLPGANAIEISPDYFETMQMHLLAGRDISASDSESSQKVLVISKSMAEQSFRGVDPIGRQITCGLDSNGEWWTIVGVVSDVRQDSPASALLPTFYVPLSQHPSRWADLQMMVRTRTDADAMTVTLDRYIKRNFPEVAAQVSTMQASIGESERAQHFRTLLFGSFAFVSILLAATGMFGLTAYSVAQRRFEFALRSALGAQRVQVLQLVLGKAAAVSAIGVAAGVALSLALMRIVGTLLGPTAGLDIGSYALAAAGILLVAVVAALGPAYRAATIEPMQVLRGE